MKKLLLIVLFIVLLPLGVWATNYSFVIETGNELSSDHTLKVIGKPADGHTFSDGDCHGFGTTFPAGDWEGFSWLSVHNDENGARLGSGFVVSSNLPRGTNLDPVTLQGGTCTQSIHGSTKTFNKFTGTVNN